MAITLSLTSTDDTEITADGDIYLRSGSSGTIDFYKSASHHLKFLGISTTLAAQTASGWVSVKCNGSNKKIFLTGTDNRIPIYMIVDDTTWVDSHYYSVGDIVLGTDGNFYRCTTAHSSTADLRPTTGRFYFYYWTSGSAPTSTDYIIFIHNFS